MSASAIKGTQSGIRQDPLSCWWKIPNKNITVLLDMQVIERITEDIKNAAIQGVSKIEIGGLLLGTVTFDPAPRVMATECFPIPCNHELGPSHRLSYADRMLLWKQINRYKETRGEFQYFVSYYRTNLGPDFRLTSSDLALARDFVPDLFFFLLIQPLDPANIGGLIFSGEGAAQPEGRILFPFDKERLLAGDTILADFPKGTMSPSPAMADEKISMEPPQSDMSEEGSYTAANLAPSSLLQSLPAPKNERKGFGRLLLSLSLGGLLVLMLVGYLYMRMKTEVSPTPRPEMKIAAKLELEAKAEQNQLYVKWNKTFPGVQSAKKGILSMQNGASTQTITLNSQELLRGDITVPYSGDQVSVQLLLVSEESTAVHPIAAKANAPSELYSDVLTEAAKTSSPKLTNEAQPQPQDPAISALSKPARASQTLPPAVAMQPRPLPKKTTEINSAAINPSPIARRGAAKPIKSPVLSVAPKSKPKLQAVAVAKSPSQPSPSSQPKEPAAIRSPQISMFPTAVSSESDSGANLSIPEPKPAPIVARNADPVPPSIPAAKPKENPEPPDAFITARPIEGLSQIVLPSNLRSQMPESMQIDVRVYVDASGTVIGAKSLYDSAQISRLAVDAVRRMRFAPARRGGQNIASDLVIKLKLVTD
jgi:protein TonB